MENINRTTEILKNLGNLSQFASYIAKGMLTNTLASANSFLGIFPGANFLLGPSAQIISQTKPSSDSKVNKDTKQPQFAKDNIFSQQTNAFN